MKVHLLCDYERVVTTGNSCPTHTRPEKRGLLVLFFAMIGERVEKERGGTKNEGRERNGTIADEGKEEEAR